MTNDGISSNHNPGIRSNTSSPNPRRSLCSKLGLGDFGGKLGLEVWLASLLIL